MTAVISLFIIMTIRFLTETERNAVLTDLEKIYAYYLGKGYTYSKRTDWPMDVMIQTIKRQRQVFLWAGPGITAAYI